MNVPARTNLTEAATETRAETKAERTRRRVLARGLELVSVRGLGGVSLGELAEHAGLSKSGFYAHFGSLEGVQLELLQAASRLAHEAVVQPALEEPPGLPRLYRFFGGFLGWAGRCGLPGGCPFVGAATEFDDVPGGVRDLLADTLQGLVGTVAGFVEEAVRLGQLRPETDAEGVAWQMFGLYTAHHTRVRLLRDPAADAWAYGALEALLAPLKPADAR